MPNPSGFLYLHQHPNQYHHQASSGHLWWPSSRSSSFPSCYSIIHFPNGNHENLNDNLKMQTNPAPPLLQQRLPSAHYKQPGFLSYHRDLHTLTLAHLLIWSHTTPLPHYTHECPKLPLLHCLPYNPICKFCIVLTTIRYFSICCCSVTKSCPTLCDPMNCSTPGFPVLHYLLKYAQIHVPWVGDAIQPSHPLPPSSPIVLNLSQHQGLFQWVGSSHQVWCNNCL